MSNTSFPKGWDEDRVHRVLQRYGEQSAEEAVAEDEAASDMTKGTKARPARESGRETDAGEGRPEYDFDGGLRGKYAERYAEGRP